MTITYLYKCRRCGEIEREKISSPELNDTKLKILLLSTFNGLFPSTLANNVARDPLPFSFHQCAGDSFGIGVTDLIGYEPEP